MFPARMGDTKIHIDASGCEGESEITYCCPELVFFHHHSVEAEWWRDDALLSRAIGPSPIHKWLHLHSHRFDNSELR